MSDGRQRQRHGVAKNLAEGIGGLLVGAAAVLLLRGWLRQRATANPVLATAVAAPTDTPSDPGQPPAKAAPSPRRRPQTQQEPTP